MATRTASHKCIKEHELSLLQIDSAVLKTNFVTMAEEIREVKTTIKSIEGKLDKFIETADTKYVTKSELDLKLKPLKMEILDTKTGLAKLGDWVAKYGPVVAIMAYVLFGRFI